MNEPLLLSWPTLTHDVGDQLRPSAGLDAIPASVFYVATDRLDQSHIERTMPNGNLIVADNYPDITVAVDDHALPGWRVAGSCVRAGFGSPLQHLPLTDRSVDVPNIRVSNLPRRWRDGPEWVQPRQRLASTVAAGFAPCSRCGETIALGSAWDLDHTDDGTGYLGVSHLACNRAAGLERRTGSTSTIPGRGSSGSWSDR